MTNTKPDVKPDELYTQKAAALKLKVNRHTLRRYERLGHIRFGPLFGRCKLTTGLEIIRCWERLYP